jgi:hypothetical protein
MTGRCQVWVGNAFRISHSDLTTASHHICMYTRGCKYSLELLMMSGVLLETCRAFNKRNNNKFYYKVASCWLFLIHTMMHGSMNIKKNIIHYQNQTSFTLHMHNITNLHCTQYAHYTVSPKLTCVQVTQPVDITLQYLFVAWKHCLYLNSFST